jgi:hypothetical protein
MSCKPMIETEQLVLKPFPLNDLDSISILGKQRVAQRLSAELARLGSAQAALKLGLCCQILRRSSPDKQIGTKTSPQPGGCCWSYRVRGGKSPPLQDSFTH